MNAPGWGFAYWQHKNHWWILPDRPDRTARALCGSRAYPVDVDPDDREARRCRNCLRKIDLIRERVLREAELRAQVKP